MIQKSFLIALFSLALLGCGGGSGGSDDNQNKKPQKPSYVNWDSVPSDFHPSIDEISFNFGAAEKINVDAFGFDRDVELIYSSELATDEGLLRIFKVWHKQASWGNLQTQNKGKVLELNTYGTYQCSIRVQNGQIVALEGGCYVKVQVIMPKSSEIEVYNVGALISKRFIPMDNESFFEALRDATWSDDKFLVIDQFLASYTGSKRPALNSEELGKVLKQFSRSEEKFKVLRRLHALVSDRESLRSVIEREFNYFDQDEAKKIVGLG
jgi:hypothetical protein